jgi:hypothetical protein
MRVDIDQPGDAGVPPEIDDRRAPRNRSVPAPHPNNRVSSDHDDGIHEHSPGAIDQPAKTNGGEGRLYWRARLLRDRRDRHERQRNHSEGYGASNDGVW